MAEEPVKKVYGAAAVMARTGSYSLNNEKIARKWNYLVMNAAGRDKWVLETAKEFIHQANIPGVYLEQAEVSMGMFREKRPFLVLWLTAIRDFRMFISARDYGVNLDVSWYLTVSPSVLKRTVSKYALGNPNALSENIDIFSQQDLSAFTTVVHSCIERTVDILLEELKLDPSGLNTSSKGFLSVW